MYRQMMELYEKVERLTAALEEERKSHREEVAAKDAQIAELKEENVHLREQVTLLQTEVVRLKEVVASQSEEISRLKSNDSNNSNNSSNPPSTDQKGAKKANEYNSRKKTKKKRGGQLGHKGQTLTKRTAEELIAAGKCRHNVIICGDPASGKYTTKYMIDVSIEPEITEYRIYKGASAQDVPCSDVFYGPKVKALALELYGVGVVSLKRIQDIISGITDGVINVAGATLYEFFRKFAERAKKDLQNIENHLMNGTVAYTDATVITINGEQGHIRNISNDGAVRYYAMEKKNLESLRKIELLMKFAGIFVHDHETTMYKFGTGHGECNVHILRYLLKNTEDSSNSWSGKLSDLLLEMKECRDKAVENGKKSLTAEELASFFTRYEEILELGYVENLSTAPKWVKKEEFSLLNRLCKYKENHLLFLKNFGVAFSNNMSERDLRKCKNRQKVAGGFRSLEGCEMYADILSIIETAKRQKRNPFYVILSLFQSPDPALDFCQG